MSDDARARGIEVYKQLNLPRATGGALPDAFRNMTMEHLFGDVWSRPDLAIRDRSLVTVTTLAALGRDPELRTHLHGALNVGVTKAELEELFLHLAHYAGWPIAVAGLRALADVLEETGRA